MSLIDILQQITASATAPNAQQVDQVTRAASKDELRGGITDALTTEQIDQLLEEKPEWLIAERESYQNVLGEQRRLKAVRAEQAREK